MQTALTRSMTRQCAAAGPSAPPRLAGQHALHNYRAKGSTACHVAAPESVTRPAALAVPAKPLDEHERQEELQDAHTVSQLPAEPVTPTNLVPQRPRNHVGTAVTEEELQRYLRLYRTQPVECGYHVPAADIQVQPAQAVAAL